MGFLFVPFIGFWAFGTQRVYYVIRNQSGQEGFKSGKIKRGQVGSGKAWVGFSWAGLGAVGQAVGVLSVKMTAYFDQDDPHSQIWVI